MVKAGDLVSNEDQTETLRFIQTAADTDGALLEMEATYKPEGTLNTSVQHYHPAQDEHFEVLSGSMSTLIDGEARVYTAGESFDIPRGTPHVMANVADEPAVVRWEVRPAMNTEDFLARLWSAEFERAQNIWLMAVMLRAYNPVFRLVKPAYPFQVVLYGLFALIGRLRGYRAVAKV